jgi:hypothetical protein
VLDAVADGGGAEVEGHEVRSAGRYA